MNFRSGSNESALRSAATLIVLDRRGSMNKTQLDYIGTEEFTAFFKKHGDSIRKRTCEIYGLEMYDLIELNSVNRVRTLVDEVEKYECKEYRAPSLYVAVQRMIESGNTAYVEFLDKLVGYITYDSIIMSILSGNRNLYNRLKEPVARIPGSTGLLDPLRQAEKRGKVLTLTDMNAVELATSSMLVALLSFAAYPESSDRMYILRDILEYVQQINFLSKRETHNYINDMGDYMSDGGLYSWSPALMEDLNTYFKVPPVEATRQKEVYEKYIKSLLDRYPRIGIVEQFYK